MSVTFLTNEDIGVSKGKNIFDQADLVAGYEVYSDGTITPQADSEYIKVKLDTTKTDLYVSGFPTYDGGINRFAAFLAEDESVLQSGRALSKESTEKHFPIPDGAYYFIISIYQRHKIERDVYKDTIQIEYSAFATEYEAPKDYLDSVDGVKIRSYETILPTQGKSLLIFGDSITETAIISDDGATYTEGIQPNWPLYSKIALKIGEMWNYAKSGARYCDWSSTQIQHRQMVSEQINDAIANNRPGDIIVMSLGTNDTIWENNYNVAMGKGTLEELDRTDFSQAVRWAMWTLRTNYPNAICFVATPIQRASKEPSNMMNEAITQMANRYNFVVIPAHTESGIVRDFETVGANGRDLKDGLHPNANGQKKMSSLYNSYILRHFTGNV